MTASTSDSSPDTFPVVHADSDGSAASRVVQSVKSAVRVPESEIKRWRRTFDTNAKALVNGERCVLSYFVLSLVPEPRVKCAWSSVRRFLDREQFVNAIAPKGDLTRIGRGQFATLFRVADITKRGLLSWDDFVVFQTLLKRPDADYYIAFQYFDVYVPHIPIVRTWLMCIWHDAEMVPVLSLLTSLRAYSRPKLALMRSRLILTGACFAVVQELWMRGAECLGIATGSSFI